MRTSKPNGNCNASGDNPRWDRLDLDAVFDDLKDDSDEAGRKRAEEFHRARQARLAKDNG